MTPDLPWIVPATIRYAWWMTVLFGLCAVLVAASGIGVPGQPGWLNALIPVVFGRSALYFLFRTLSPRKIVVATRQGLNIDGVRISWADITAIEIRPAPNLSSRHQNRLVIARTPEDAALLETADTLHSLKAPDGSDFHYLPGVDEHATAMPLEELQAVLRAFWQDRK